MDYNKIREKYRGLFIIYPKQIRIYHQSMKEIETGIEKILKKDFNLRDSL